MPPAWAPPSSPMATIRARRSTIPRTSSAPTASRPRSPRISCCRSVTFFRQPLTDPNTGQFLHFDGASNTNSVVAVPYIGASYRDQPACRGRPRGRCTVRCGARFPRRRRAAPDLVTSIALRAISISPGGRRRSRRWPRGRRGRERDLRGSRPRSAQLADRTSPAIPSSIRIRKASSRARRTSRAAIRSASVRRSAPAIARRPARCGSARA